jgi:hypothetical protein
MSGNYSRWKRCHGTSIGNVKMMLADVQRTPRRSAACRFGVSQLCETRGL